MHSTNCTCQNCLSHRRVRGWLVLALVAMVFWLLWTHKFLGQEKALPKLTKGVWTLDSDLRDGVKSVSKRCPECTFYKAVGDLATPTGAQPCALLFIKDTGATFRIEHFKTQRGVPVVVLYFPGQVVDLEFIKFVKPGAP